MATVAEDLVTALAAATWVTITKPTLTVKENKETDLLLSYGWISSGTEEVSPETLGGHYGTREVPFEIYIACESATNQALYKSNIETIIPALSVTGGWYELTSYPHEQTLRRHTFRVTGRKIYLA